MIPTFTTLSVGRNKLQSRSVSHLSNFFKDFFLYTAAGSPLAGFIVFVVVNLLFGFLDLTGRPRALLKYKIQENKPVPVSKYIFNCVGTNSPGHRLFIMPYQLLMHINIDCVTTYLFPIIENPLPCTYTCMCKLNKHTAMSITHLFAYSNV